MDDLPHTVAAWNYSVRTAAPYDVDHRLRSADGSYRWFHSRGIPLQDSEGRITRWYNLLTDIHDRKQAEEARHRLEQELQNERDRLRLLLDLNNRVASHLDLRQLFEGISSELRQVFKCYFVGLAWPDASGKYLQQHMVDFPDSKELLKEGALYPMGASCS